MVNIKIPFRYLFCDFVYGRGADERADLIFKFSKNGKELMVETVNGIYSHEKLLAVCCAYEMSRGNDVAVPFDSPEYFDLLSENARVLRYLSNPAGKSDSEARNIASKQWFSVDALFLAAKLLFIVRETGKSLGKLVSELPQKYVSVKLFKINFSPSKLSEVCSVKAETIDKKELCSLFADEATRQITFSKLIKSYQQRLYWHIRKMVMVHDDANDILQNTFIKAWTNLLSYRGDASFTTWIYRIATNETLDFLQSAYARHAGESVDFETSLAGTIDHDPYFDGDAAEKLLYKAIATLPDKQRLVFNMRYFDEMPYAQMSEIVGTSEGALKASYHLAVKKVEQYILDHR